MFTFRNTTLAFFVALFAMNLLYAAGIDLPLWCWIALISCYLFISVFFSFFICSGFHMKAVCHGSRDEKKIVLTFDDGPDPATTPLILDILKEENVKATFFVIGKKLDGNEPLIRRIIEEGHLVGGHSFSHSNWFDFFPWKKIRNELIMTEDRIMKITGNPVRLFRPPYGVINPLVRKALSTRNYIITGYSNRLWDTVTKDENRVLRRFKKQLRPGDIVLLHDTAVVTSRILPEMIRHTKASGYSVVSLQELLNIEPYENL